ncbi:MATE family efflux transporter [Loktanella agnita]|uniref:MATE family efflux transporter n=1 Tax=Loktanella agnita TaxID=287097 RepID=UPI0039862E2C
MADPRLLRLIIRLGVPAIFGLSANAINQFIDALWITRLSPVAMAAIGVTFPVFIVVMAATAGIGVACAGEIGRRLGRKDVDGAQNIALTAFFVAIGISAFVALVVGAMSLSILPQIGASAETFPMAQRYMLVLLCAVPMASFQIISDFVALGSGNSKRSMQSLFACFGLNMLLDPIFIFGFGWGVTGAALATVAGQILACTLYIVWFRNGTLGLRPLKGHHSRENLNVLLRFSPPVAMVNLLMALSFLLLISATARLADDIYLAALTFELRLASLIIIPMRGLSLGAQAAVSHAYGALDELRANRLIHRIFALSIGLGLAMTALILMVGPALLPSLIPAPAMREASAAMFPYFAAFIIGSCAYIPLLAGFQATDRALYAAIVALAPNGYAMVPLVIFLPMIWGFQGLLFAVALSGVVTALIAGGLHIMSLSRISTTLSPAPAETP